MEEGFELNGESIQKGGEFSVCFQRTLRVPDNGKTYPLPPSFGSFPLKKVSDFKDKVPKEWLKQGGVFFPMHSCEAMWMYFNSKNEELKALKIATGKVNSITGEQWNESIENSQTTKQDYIVLPKQQWLDGINIGNGEIRQFVAMPKNSGISIEQQVTGEDKYGGLQLKLFNQKSIIVQIKEPVSESLIDLKCLVGETIDKIKEKIQSKIMNGLPLPGFDFKLKGKEIKDTKSTLWGLGIKENTILEVFERSMIVQIKEQVSGNLTNFHCLDSETIEDIKRRIRHTIMHDILLRDFDFKLNGIELTNTKSTLLELGIKENTILEVFERPHNERDIKIIVKMLTGHCFPLRVSLQDTVEILKELIEDVTHQTPDKQRIIFDRRQLEDEQILADCKICKECTVHLVHRLRGGGEISRGGRGGMSLCAGGKITQKIYMDDNGRGFWTDEGSTRVFVHIVNSQVYEQITGEKPPKSPINAKTYIENDYPWFELYDEPQETVPESQILSKVQSVATMASKPSKNSIEDGEW